MAINVISYSGIPISNLQGKYKLVREIGILLQLYL